MPPELGRAGQDNLCSFAAWLKEKWRLFPGVLGFPLVDGSDVAVNLPLVSIVENIDRSISKLETSSNSNVPSVEGSVTCGGTGAFSGSRSRTSSSIMETVQSMEFPTNESKIFAQGLGDLSYPSVHRCRNGQVEWDGWIVLAISVLRRRMHVNIG